MSFDTLPPELMMLILELLESTTDLYSVISASPTALRVFRITSDRVLLTVTQRRMEPQSLRHAVAIISVPNISMNRPEHSRFTPLWNFLDSYFNSRSNTSEDILLDPSKARALATLHAHVCRHIRRYADQTCAQLSSVEYGRVLDESRQHAIDGASQQLSSTELIRLEHGFYRYELYCRVSPAEPGNALQSRSSYREQFDHFIKRLEAWEMEEIVCIHEYLVFHLGIIVDDLESQLVTRFLANSCREPPVGDAQQVVYYDNLDMRQMMLFSTEFRKDSLHNLGYIAASGLPFLNSVFHAATNTERLDLVRSHGPGTRDLLADALYRAEEIPHSPISRDFVCDDPSLPNLGYLEYAPDVTTIYMQISEASIRWLPMRLLGYVFWDSDRLENPLARSIIKQGQDMPRSELRQRFDRSKQPSAEARLYGFRVRREVMDDLVRDYSSTLELFPPIDEVEEVERPGACDSDDSCCEGDASYDGESYETGNLAGPVPVPEGTALPV